MMSMYHIARWRRKKAEADAMCCVAGNRSCPKSLAGWIMTAGVAGTLAGLLVSVHLLLFSGVVLLIGLAVAILEAILEH